MPYLTVSFANTFESCCFPFSKRPFNFFFCTQDEYLLCIAYKPKTTYSHKHKAAGKVVQNTFLKKDAANGFSRCTTLKIILTKFHKNFDDLESAQLKFAL